MNFWIWMQNYFCYTAYIFLLLFKVLYLWAYFKLQCKVLVLEICYYKLFSAVIFIEGLECQTRNTLRAQKSTLLFSFLFYYHLFVLYWKSRLWWPSYLCVPCIWDIVPWHCTQVFLHCTRITLLVIVFLAGMFIFPSSIYIFVICFVLFEGSIETCLEVAMQISLASNSKFCSLSLLTNPATHGHHYCWM